MNKSVFLAICLTLVLSLTLVSAYTIARTGPSTVTPGQQFTITYTTDATGDFGFIIHDSVTGGCTFPDGTNTYKNVLISLSGKTITATVTAPASGSCTFNGGTYQSPNDTNPINFDNLIVSTGTACTPSSSCASTTCSGTTCSDGCGGTVQGTKTCTCTPSTTACSSKQCGSVDNGCGTQISCGTCSGSTPTCSNNQCTSTECTPDNSCASSTCSTTTCTNNCGNSIQGTKSCTTFEVCSIASKFNFVTLFKDETACFNGVVDLIGGFLIFIFLISVLKGK